MKNYFIIYILFTIMQSQGMYIDNNKQTVFSVASFYNEGRNRGSIPDLAYSEYGLGIISILKGKHELGITSRRVKGLENKDWSGINGIYNYYIKPNSPVNYFIGNLYSRLKNNSNKIDEYMIKFGLYGEIKGAKSSGLSYYPFFYLGQQHEIINYLNTDEANSYNVFAIGLSLMFQDSKTSGIGIEPVYIKSFFNDGDRACIDDACDYDYIGLNIYLWEYSTYKKGMFKF